MYLNTIFLVYLLVGFFFSNSTGECENLPSHCHFIDYRRYTNNFGHYQSNPDGLICENDFDDKIVEQFTNLSKECTRFRGKIMFFILFFITVASSTNSRRVFRHIRTKTNRYRHVWHRIRIFAR